MSTEEPRGTFDDATSLRRCVRELAALSTLSAVWRGHDLPQIADGLAGVLLRALPIDVVYVRLNGLGADQLVEVARTPDGPIPSDRMQQVGQALHGNWTDGSGTASIANPVGDGVLRLVIVPLGYECGTLIAGSEQADFPTLTDRLILGVAGNQAAIVLHHRRAQESLKRQTERLGLLWEAASVLLVAEEPDAMLRELLARIGGHLGVDTYVNYVMADSGDALRLASCQGIPAAAVSAITRLDFGQAISGAVARRREPLVVTNIQQAEDAISQRAKSFGLRACVCNPLLVGDRLLGTLLYGSRSRDHFDAEEVAFIETICHYVTVALERLRLLAALQESDRRKDEFLATLAHELRNPLAPIRSAVKVLDLKGSQAPEPRWAREVIARQLQHLTRLIDDLLEISRITRNQLELRKRPITLEQVVGGALEASRPLIEASGHTLAVSLPSEPVYIDGDLVRLSQVVLNLLNNAAKYTEPNGRIWLTAEYDAATVTLRIKDTGVGIRSEDLPLLFEMFYQVDRSRERAKGGLGIGLALVRRLVEAHGGTVEARSDGVGTGTELMVRLPLLPAEAMVPSESEEAPAPTVSGARILVVDDNKDSADSLCAFLRLTGNEVYSAYDGLQALEVAEQCRPNVVLLDIGMPRLDGEETCRRLRATPRGAGMTIIALTGWGQEEDRRRTLAAGFDAHLIKPVDPADVTMLIESRRQQPAK